MELAKRDSVRPTTTSSKEAFLEEMAKLESTKYSLGKSINELESNLARTESALRNKLDELQNLKAEVTAGNSSPPLPLLIRHQIYKDLGVDWLFDDFNQLKSKK